MGKYEFSTDFNYGIEHESVVCGFILNHIRMVNNEGKNGQDDR